jgi:uncharacterized protein (DUF433 family)
MVTHPTTFTRIVRNPEILDGEPVVAGTRVPVRVLVQYDRIYCHDLEQLGHSYPTLTRADIEEALAFYEVHREEIDWYIAENEDDEDD